MRSQVIRIRNLPADQTVRHSVHVKPTVLMVIFLLAGIVMLFMRPYLMIAAMMMILLAVFSLTVMPDRKLVEFTDDYLILYNQSDKTRCFIVYWEDMVNWKYEWHPSYDQLVVTLTDGSTQMQEMYSRLPIQHYMDKYAKGKEMKNRAIKRSRT